jgi:glycosyltransferase involved in cell wall biosynthesis
MSKKRIAILSVLKPVDDTRNFEKMATSLGNTNKYEINIIGFSAKNLSVRKNVIFHPIFHFARNHPARILAAIQAFRKLIKLSPELIIVTCAELLIVIPLCKIIFGCKVVYDLQENYYQNIRYTDTYPPVIRHLLASTVRSVERISAPLVDHFLLAEKIYRHQLPFIGQRFEVIENKALITPRAAQRVHTGAAIKTFLYSGTIARHYGIFEAVSFMKKMHIADKNVKLRIVGFAPDRRVLRQLLKQIDAVNYIELISDKTPIPHQLIFDEMLKADFCLLPYRRHRSTEGRWPTKLFECLAMEIPVVIMPNPVWNDTVTKYKAGILHDFSKDIAIPVEDINNNKFYGTDRKSEWYWSCEEPKLIRAIDELMDA